MDASRAAPRRLSVVFVAPQFHPLVGGAEVRALREAQALRAAGHTVRVLTLRWRRALPALDEVDGVPVRRIGGVYFRGRLLLGHGALFVAELPLLWDLLRARATYDLIHVRQFSVVARAAGLAALLARKPLLARLGNVDPPPDFPVQAGAQARLHAGDLDPSLPFLTVPAGSWSGGGISEFMAFHHPARLWLRFFRRRGVTFTAISTAMRRHLLHFGFRPDQIVVLPNGVDPQRYAEAADAVAARAAADEVGAPTVVCVARLSYEKGHDLLLHAWRRVHASLPAARLVLVGDGPLRPQLEGLAAALGLGESVAFAGKAADPRVHLARADLYVLPSRWEGMPNALLEAMACGLPCVATRVSGSEDLIVDGESGLLVPPVDPDAMAEAVLALLADRARARMLGVAARERILAEFDQRDLVARLMALYARLIAFGTPAGEETEEPSSAAVPAGPRPTGAFVLRSIDQTSRVGGES